VTIVEFIIPSAAAAAVFFASVGVVAWIAERRDPTRRGIGEFSDPRFRRNELAVRLRTMLAPIGERMLPILGGERSRIEATLYLAGLRQKNAAALFLLTKVVLVISLPATTWLLAREFAGLSSAPSAALAGAMLLVALIAPNLWLARRVRLRQTRLRSGFSDTLDMLVICVEAGLGLTAAIERVTSEIRDLYPELAAELTAVNAEMRSGVDRSTALQGLNARTGLPEIRGLVSLMVQTLQLGTGVADSLRIYSSEFRDQRMQHAEQRAATIGTKMIFPLVLCELPAFFLVAVGPAVLRLFSAFGT
jgi:tight adherence protein C